MGLRIDTGFAPRTQLGGPDLGDGLLLPTAVLWPGFAVNAAFYAGVCWVLLAAPGVVVRWRRRRRGRCAACGYDLTGLDACPECGGGA